MWLNNKISIVIVLTNLMVEINSNKSFNNGHKFTSLIQLLNEDL